MNEETKLLGDAEVTSITAFALSRHVINSH